MPTWIVEVGCAYVFTTFAVTVLWFGCWRPQLRAADRATGCPVCGDVVACRHDGTTYTSLPVERI